MAEHTNIHVACLVSMLFVAPACATPRVPAGPPAVVHFEAGKDQDSYRVRVVDAAGRAAECETPCDLGVASGTARIEVSGDASYRTTRVIPAGRSEAEVERKNRGMAALTWALGGAAIVTALSVGATTGSASSNTTIALGATAIGFGVAGVVTSLFVGGDYVSVRPRSADLAAAGGSTPRIVPLLSVAPGREKTPVVAGLGLALSF